MRIAPSVALSPEERAVLERWAGSAGRSPRAVRARIVLATAEGRENRTIAHDLGVSRITVARWRLRFLRHRLPGLDDRPRVVGAPRVSEATVTAIVRATTARAAPGGRPWTTRSLAHAFGVSHMTVRRIWQAYQIRPLQFRTSSWRPDPVAPLRPYDVVGLYLHPPTAALVSALGRRSAHSSAGEPERRMPDGPEDRPGFPEIPSVPVAIGTPASRPPSDSSGDLRRFLAGIARRADPVLPQRLLVTGSGARDAALLRGWLVRHPNFQLVSRPDWESWSERAMREIRQIGSTPRRAAGRSGSAELARTLARFLRDYRAGSAPFEWRAPTASRREGLAAFRLRYDLAVTGHPGFKSPASAPARVPLPSGPTAPARAMARTVLQKCLRVGRGDRVTIDSWSSSLGEANAFVLEATRLGARPVLLHQDEGAYWAATAEAAPEHLGHLGEHVRVAVERSDALVSFFGPSDRERFHALPPRISDRLSRYGDALYAAAAKAGVRSVQMAIGRASAASARLYGVDLAQWRRELLEGCLVEPRELRRRGRPIADRFAAGREVAISHANGTDLRLRLKKRTALLADGFAAPARRGGKWNLVTLPAGVVTVAVDERYAEGTFRSNVTSSVGLSGGVGEFAGGRWTFEKGRLVRHAYEQGAELFDESYGSAGAGRDRPGALSVGLNDALAISPLLEDQGTGTISLHLGRNDYLGGSNSVPWWAWLYLRGADLTVDGEPLVRGGRLV